jgi:hypothetical protein
LALVEHRLFTHVVWFHCCFLPQEFGTLLG